MTLIESYPSASVALCNYAERLKNNEEFSVADVQQASILYRYARCSWVSVEKESVVVNRAPKDAPSRGIRSGAVYNLDNRTSILSIAKMLVKSSRLIKVETGVWKLKQDT